jgi:hypothetical protein
MVEVRTSGGVVATAALPASPILIHAPAVEAEKSQSDQVQTEPHEPQQQIGRPERASSATVMSAGCSQRHDSGHRCRPERNDAGLCTLPATRRRRYLDPGRRKFARRCNSIATCSTAPGGRRTGAHRRRPGRSRTRQGRTGRRDSQELDTPDSPYAEGTSPFPRRTISH